MTTESDDVQIDHDPEIDRQYDPRYLTPDFQQTLDRYATESAATRRDLACSLDVRYGPGPDETLDIFPASQPDAPIAVFVHGGYWQSSTSRDHSFVARGLVARGVSVVVTNYSYCPNVTIADITRQTWAALAWVYREAHTFRGDPGRIIVIGHSAGAQQVGMLLAAGWHERHGLPGDVIRGAVVLGGLFDLEPLRRSSLQGTLRLTAALVADQSPQRHVPDAAPPLLVSVGADESPEFHRQSREYLAAWRARGLTGELLVQPGCDHFTALLGLAAPDSPLCEAVLALIAGTTRAAVGRVPRDRPSRASFAQERLWFVAQLDPGSCAYNEPILIRMDEPVHPVVLQDCLGELVRRHEAWRTAFVMVNGELHQRILPPAPFPLEVVDLRAASPDARAAEFRRLAAEHARRPFDLAAGRLVRALLVLTGEREAHLVVTAHHIVVDGLSFFAVFLPELSTLYAAFTRGEASPLAEPTFQYTDFATWQRAWLDEDNLAPKLAYWRAQLADLSELKLPHDLPRPPAPTGRGARAPVTLSAELTRRLRELGRSADVSLFTTLLAAWQTLLFRYTDQTDIVVGSAAAGRPRPEFERSIGFFNNNLVLRTRLAPAWTFTELLPRVGATLQAAREHQDVPFERLVAAVDAPRPSVEAPLYNNVFLLMPPAPRLDATPGWSAARFDIGVAKVDLYLELHQGPAGLSGHLEYRSDRFTDAAIARMIGHFETLLTAVAEDPTQRLEQLPILTAAEEQQLALWQGPAADASTDRDFQSLEQLFSAQARRTPDAIAVEHGERRLTYAALEAHANHLAHDLRARGVGPDTLVGLHVVRSIPAIVAILAVLKAGGAYVPLDPAYPRERLRCILADAELRFVLASPACTGDLPEFAGQVLVLADDPAPSPSPVEPPDPDARADDLAYVIYTSGSTGRPKGVMVARRGLHHLAAAQRRAFDLGVGSRVLQFFSLNFDGSVWDFTITWPVGATLVLADSEALVPGPGLTDLLQRKDIHAVMLTPSALAVTPVAPLPALRVLITGGEALPAELVDRWADGRRVFNAYGPTEITVCSNLAECGADEGTPPIGRPFAHVSEYILDARMRPVPVGVSGELYIGGPGLARGYLRRPTLTAERFVPDPSSPSSRLYRTGDRARWRSDGSIDFLGRNDHQIKLRGFRVELEEIDAEIARHPAVDCAAVRAIDTTGEIRLIGYFVARPDAPPDLADRLRDHLRDRLPAYMVPPVLVRLDRMPRSPGGKLDRTALPAPEAPPRSRAAGRSPREQTLTAIWQAVLGVADIDVDAPFFSVGGHSLALVRVQADIRSRLGVDIDILTLLRLSTIRQLARHLDTLEAPAATTAIRDDRRDSPLDRNAVAIVGMAVRVPGASTPEELWDIVRTGRETLSVLDPAALLAAGADPARVNRPEFVPAEGVLADADRFDAGFFGYSDADAAMMDPQQRLFLECAHQALEHAGCDPRRSAARIGVFAGAGAPLHWLGAVGSGGTDMDRLRARTLNAPDFLPTRVAFKLGLRGPAVGVQTACSTSLAAVHLARQNLLAGECDVALAGGVTLSTLHDADRGYLHDPEGGHESADGHCRPFDARASGMVRSSGVAVVLLKRLADALRDRDTIHAVILGSAMTNDGAAKIGFTAPSEDGIAETVQRAHASADVDPRSLGLVEAHGTGTRLGDPIEVRALTRAFRARTTDLGFCALGSVKANLGHVDAAAGATGLIKATLALAHATLPPVAGFASPNPLLDLPGTPFFVPTAAQAWPRGGSPRRAAVNALGIGGTNVHVVLEEAPAADETSNGRPFQLLCLSARDEAALTGSARNLADHLEKHPDLALADVAFTLAVGRTQHSHRAAIVGRDSSSSRTALAGATTRGPANSARPVVFLFPGHGTHYARMGHGVYEAEPVFRAEVDRCFAIIAGQAGLDLRSFWLAEPTPAASTPDEVVLVQTLLFTIEYALAKQWLAWGVRPAAMLGHSLGEYVAACVAGVLDLEDALALVVARSRLAETTPPGRMLMVFAEAHAVEPHLDPDVTIATHAPGSVVLTGLVDAVDRVAARLADAGIATTVVQASRAGHSPVLRSVREAFRRHVAAVRLRPPTIPIIANLTGRRMTPVQAVDPDAWADHLCSPVRLADGLGAVLELEAPICLELGPGSSLVSALKRHPRFAAANADTATTLPDPRRRDEPAHESLLRGLGRAWELGAEIDWPAFYRHEARRRVPLPTYPFAGRRYPPSTPAPVRVLAAPSDLDARVAAMKRAAGIHTIDDHPGLRARLTALCADLVLAFMTRRLGDADGRRLSMASLRDELQILPDFTRMLAALVALLEREGLASRAADEIRLQPSRPGRATELATALIRDYPGFTGLVRLVEHCVAHYDDALTGAVPPIGVLFPDGTDTLYRSFMRATAPYQHERIYLDLAADLAVEAVRARPGRKLRILEIGAGHGTLTWPLAERLRPADVEYHFTDIGRSFLHHAESEAARRNLPFLATARFDLNLPPDGQGIQGPYDLVLGFNVIHVAHDAAATLQRLHDLLAPDGSLILIVRTQLDPWDDLVFGLSPGYWDAATHARGEPADNLSHWAGLLRRGGFSRVTRVPGDARPCEHGLLLAGRGASAARTPEPARLPVDPPPAPAATTQVADGVEQLVRDLWSRLLGLPRPPAATSFFELGGDSLLAVQLLAELRTRTGRELKLQRFVARPTIDGVVACLRETTGSSPVATPPPPRPDLPECLVPLQRAGTRAPFFCIHPIGGSVLGYAALARAIDPDRPFYGVQSPMLGDPAVRPCSLAELAATYVSAIRTAQSGGQYLVGGFSFGGVVAIEVARQLAAAGERVAMLVLLDAIPTPPPWLELLHRIDERLAVASLLPTILATGAPSRATAPDRLSRFAADLGAAAGNLAIVGHHLALWRTHTPTSVDVPVIHFVPERTPLCMRLLPAARRTPPIRGLRSVQVPGDHGTILAAEHAPALGARIRDVLDAADPPDDEASVHTFMHRLTECMNNRDASALVDGHWTRSAACALVPAHSDARIGAEKIKNAYLHSFGALRSASVRFHHVHVQVFADGRAACVTALLDSDLVHAESGRRTSHRDVRVSLGLERQDGTWKIVSAHYSQPVVADPAAAPDASLRRPA